MNTKILFLTFSIFLIVFTGSAFASIGSSCSKVTDEKNNMKISESFGNLPLQFQKNVGQTDGQVKFLSRGNGYSILLTPTEVVMVLSRTPGRSKLDLI